MLRAQRWTRYGQDRVYVTHLDGTKVGFIDLKTGKTQIDRIEWAEEFHTIIGPYLRNSMQDWVDSVQEEGDVTPPNRHDLSANAAGQAARQEANAHLARMQEQSRLRALLARTLDVHTEERAWRKGAQGEEYVGARLERLNLRGWHALHAVPVGHRGADIDHVLIGPGGVFTINTKNHPGKRVWVSPNQIRVNGEPVPYLQNSRFEAERASELLSARVGWPVHARAVLVLLTGTVVPRVTVRNGGPADVWVLSRLDLPGRFAKTKPILTAKQIEEVYIAARRPETWTASR